MRQRLRQWWGRRSLRGRLMLIGVTGLALGFVVGGAALIGVLGLVLQRAVDADIDATARSVATLVETDSLPVPVPVPAGDQVQVVDRQGRVLASSADADPLVPIVPPDDLARLRAGEHLVVLGGPTNLHTGPLRVTGVVIGDGTTVIVARSMADVMRGLELLREQLLIVFPLLLAGSAIVAWRVINASLRPVEALRRGAEAVTGGPARLPVPAGDDEIHRLAVTLNGMLERLERGRVRQREFVADAAHELRSPLANMRTQLEVALRLGTAADWPGVGQDLLADTDRLSRLVDDLLLLARADATPGPARWEPVELHDLARDVLRRAASEPGRPCPQIQVVDDDPVWTVGDPDELRRVLGNLVDNAVRHARTDVVVAATRDGDRALLTVTDGGPGIPPADRERVFDRFTRLDDSRTVDTGGAGLGLAIVRELVRRHGGEVTLSDAGSADPDHPGLRVEVRLPLDPQPAPSQ